MPDLLLLFNHSISRLQENDARRNLKVGRIISPPDEIQELWSNVPSEIGELNLYLQPVLQWLDSSGRVGDYVLIQGDFGACYFVARHALQAGFIPIYSTTLRQAEERHLDDERVELTHTFKHVRYRRYGV